MPHNLKHIGNQFVIEKFTSKSCNANQRIDMFKNDYIYFDLTTGEKKIELLRLFMARLNPVTYAL